MSTRFRALYHCQFYSENPQNTYLGILQTKADLGPFQRAKTKRKVLFSDLKRVDKDLVCDLDTYLWNWGEGGGCCGETALLSIVNISISSQSNQPGSSWVRLGRRQKNHQWNLPDHVTGSRSVRQV